MKSIVLTVVALFLSSYLLAQQTCGNNEDLNQFANTMTVIASLNIEGKVSTDSLDVLQAHVEGTCRGSAQLLYVPSSDRYLALLLVRSNAENNEDISFSIYDNSSGNEYAVAQTVRFETDARYGSLNEPLQLETDPNKTPIDDIMVDPFFSPNGDGINDTWEIRNAEELQVFELTILDDTGQEVFKAFPYDNSWDGTYKGKELPMDVYYYILKSSERPEVFSGAISIIR